MDDMYAATFTGNKYHFLAPDPGQISFPDIATALSRKARYNGHTNTPVASIYSVAQHSCLVYDEVVMGAPLTCSPKDYYSLVTWALLHDASEAYLPDVHSLLKDYLGGFRELERRSEKAIADRFSLPDNIPPLVKTVDRRVMATEKRDLMYRDDSHWAILDGIEPYEGQIVVWSVERSFQEFTRRFDECMRTLLGVNNGG